MNRIKLIVIVFVTHLSILANAVPPVLLADYQFDSNLSSTVVSAPDLTYLGAGGAYSSQLIDGVQKTVFDFETGQGLQLDVSSLLNDTDYSIFMNFKIQTTNGYKKLIDYKNLSMDDGFYNDSGRLRFYSASSSSNFSVISVNQFIKVVISRDPSGQVEIYAKNGINNNLMIGFADTLDDGLPSIEALLHFFRDDNATSNTENSAGSVSRISIYDRALTLLEVNLLFGEFVFKNGFE